MVNEKAIKKVRTRENGCGNNRAKQHTLTALTSMLKYLPSRKKWMAWQKVTG